MVINLKASHSKVKHIETRFLWIQDAIRAKRFSLKKVKTEENPADLFDITPQKKLFKSIKLLPMHSIKHVM